MWIALQRMPDIATCWLTFGPGANQACVLERGRRPFLDGWHPCDYDRADGKKAFACVRLPLLRPPPQLIASGALILRSTCLSPFYALPFWQAC
jgi:hypothetical protein